MAVEAEYAIQSKYPGDAGEYRTLEWSQGPLTREDFDKIFESLRVGNLPSGGATQGEHPPWIIFGGYQLPGPTSAHYLVVIIREWTDAFDIDGDNIALSFCLCIPYQKLAQRGIDFLSLSKLLPENRYGMLVHRDADANARPSAYNELTGETNQHVPITLPDLTSRRNEIATHIGSDFNYFAGLASLLLQSLVVVKGSDLTLDVRLADLDAAASLLPYGVRPFLSLTTWMQNGAPRSIRLGFSDLARPEQVFVKRKEFPYPLLIPGSAARDYYETLVKIHARRRTEYIIEQLALHTTPTALEDLHAILWTLNKMDLPHIIYTHVIEGRGDPDAVCHLYTSGRANELKLPEQHIALLKFLLNYTDQVSYDIVAQQWPAFDDALWFHLTEHLMSALADPVNKADKSDALLKLAANVKRLDDLLAEVLRFALNAYNRGEETQAKYATKLLLNNIGNLKKPERKPLLNAIAHNQGFLYFFILRAAPDNLVTTLEWFDLSDDFNRKHLRAFRIATGLEEKLVLTTEMLNDIASVDPAVVWNLIDLAIEYKQQENFVMAALDWLLAIIQETPQKQQYPTAWAEWPAIVGQLLPDNPSNYVQAKFTILQMLVVPDETLPYLSKHLRERVVEPSDEFFNSIATSIVSNVLRQHLVQELLNYLTNIISNEPPEKKQIIQLNSLVLLHLVSSQLQSSTLSEPIYKWTINLLTQQLALLAQTQFHMYWQGKLENSSYRDDLHKLQKEWKLHSLKREIKASIQGINLKAPDSMDVLAAKVGSYILNNDESAIPMLIIGAISDVSPTLTGQHLLELLQNLYSDLEQTHNRPVNWRHLQMQEIIQGFQNVQPSTRVELARAYTSNLLAQLETLERTADHRPPPEIRSDLDYRRLEYAYRIFADQAQTIANIPLLKRAKYRLQQFGASLTPLNSEDNNGSKSQAARVLYRPESFSIEAELLAREVEHFLPLFLPDIADVDIQQRLRDCLSALVQDLQTTIRVTYKQHVK